MTRRSTQKAARRRPGRRELAAPARQIPAWDDMPDDLKPVLARQMEVYADSSSTPTTTSAG